MKIRFQATSLLIDVEKLAAHDADRSRGRNC
jgi:hypothetical protein